VGMVLLTEATGIGQVPTRSRCLQLVPPIAGSRLLTEIRWLSLFGLVFECAPGRRRRTRHLVLRGTDMPIFCLIGRLMSTRLIGWNLLTFDGFLLLRSCHVRSSCGLISNMNAGPALAVSFVWSSSSSNWSHPRSGTRNLTRSDVSENSTRIEAATRFRG
jgi:hypothetical protein